MSKVHLIAAEAHGIAGRIREAYAPVCELMEVAGSVRRGCERVGDIEFVCVPRVATNLLGEPDAGVGTELDAKLKADVEGGRLGPAILDGPKQKRFPLVNRGGLCVEFYLVDATTWGVAMAIRTGCREFSTALVTERCRGGLLPDGYAVHQLRVWRRSRRDTEGKVVEVSDAVATPREEDVLRVCCGRWVEPWRRGPEVVRELRAGWEAKVARGYAA